MKDAAILVFANKQDLPNAMGVSELTDKLRLHSQRDRTVSSSIINTSYRNYLRAECTFECMIVFQFFLYTCVYIKDY